MATLGFLSLFVLLGLAVLFVAFSGGPGRAREAYLTRGGRAFTVAIVLLYVALGITLPAVVIADREEGPSGGTEVADSKQMEDGKRLFRATCATCHDLDAVNARGVTGPDLDELGEMNKERVLNAIANGGPVSPDARGTGRMPAGLLTGKDAEAVAEYVSKVAGK